MPGVGLPVVNLCGGLWNEFEHEVCSIHMLRLIAMAIDDEYQEAVKKALRVFDGRYEYRGAPIKGDARMRNKCVSVDDHRAEPKPRWVLSERLPIYRERDDKISSQRKRKQARQQHRHQSQPAHV